MTLEEAMVVYESEKELYELLRELKWHRLRDNYDIMVSLKDTFPRIYHTHKEEFDLNIKNALNDLLEFDNIKIYASSNKTK